MTLTDARLWVRQFARNAKESSEYAEADVDRAIMGVGEDFCRVTKCLQDSGEVDVTATVADLDTSELDGFRPERCLSATLSGVAKPLARPGWDTVRENAVKCPATGAPCAIGWADSAGTKGLLWPTPVADGTLTLRWWQPFVTWAAGTITPNSVTLNLPEEYLSQILTYGAPAMLQQNEPEHKYAAESWKKYLAYRQSMIGAGRTGAQTLPRDMMR